MNKKTWFSIALGTGLTLLALPGGRPQAQIAATQVADEVIVQFARSTPMSRRASILAAETGRDIQRFDQFDIHHVRLNTGRNVQLTLAALRQNPEVVAAQPNYVRHAVQASTPPSDPFWLNGSLWGLQKIQAQTAWNAYGGGSGTVVIADIDTGVDYTHPDLAANMWRNPGEIAANGIDDDLNGHIDDVHGIDTYNNDTNPMDDNGHGTHTAGTIAGVGNNGIGVAGVNWNARILACKFLNSAGNGSDAGAIGCFNYIVALRQRGINIKVSSNSWGALRDAGGPSAPLKNAIDAAGSAGILNVFAAGNNGINIDTTPYDPAAFTSSSILSVAASDQAENRAGFSNYGVVGVDIAAPGVSILSTYNSGYAQLSGTSMATPHAAGAAAYLAALDPTLSVDSLKFLLMNEADDLAQWGGLVASGGRLNLSRAATATGAPPAPTPTPTPTPTPSTLAVLPNQTTGTTFPSGGVARFLVQYAGITGYVAELINSAGVTVITRTRPNATNPMQPSPMADAFSLVVNSVPLPNGAYTVRVTSGSLSATLAVCIAACSTPTPTPAER